MGKGGRKESSKFGGQVQDLAAVWLYRASRHFWTERLQVHQQTINISSNCLVMTATVGKLHHPDHMSQQLNSCHNDHMKIDPSCDLDASTKCKTKVY